MPSSQPSPAIASRRNTRPGKMSLRQTYTLAAMAKDRLYKEFAKGDFVNLRFLLGHASLVDGLTAELAEAEREQESWFNQTVSNAAAEQAAPSPKHIQWATAVVENYEAEEEDDNDDYASSEDSSDDDDEDYSSSFYRPTPLTPLRRVPSPPPRAVSSQTQTTIDLDLNDYSDTDSDSDLDYDDEDASSSVLALTRTSSHSVLPTPPKISLSTSSSHSPSSSPPELTHDLSDEDHSDDDAGMPPSPPMPSENDMSISLDESWTTARKKVMELPGIGQGEQCFGNPHYGIRATGL
jgi:hypothetical protein